MAKTWTTTELLEDIRDNTRTADDDPEATDEILLRHATRVLESTYVPAVRSTRGDYYVISADLEMTRGIGAYGIPRRATVASVRTVRVVDSAGTEYELIQIPLEDVPTVRSSAYGTPAFFALADDRVEVRPAPSSSDFTLRVSFEYRPSQLVAYDAATAARVVTASYDYSADTYTLVADVDVFVDDDFVDVIRKDPPFASPVIDARLNATGATSGGYGLDLVSWVGVASRPPADVAGSALGVNALGLRAGDYIMPEGTTPIPQIPPELHPCLAMHTAARWLLPIDPSGSQALDMKANEELRRLLSAMQPRKTGTQPKNKPRTRNVAVYGGYGRGGRTFGDLR